MVRGMQTTMAVAAGKTSLPSGDDVFALPGMIARRILSERRSILDFGVDLTHISIPMRDATIASGAVFACSMRFLHVRGPVDVAR